MRKVDIIIPVRNNPKETADSINAILENTLYSDYQIIIVESESTDGCDKLVDELQNLHPDKIKVFHTKKEGITKAINFGIKNSREGSDIYLSQNDVILPKLYKRDWLGVLVWIAENYPNVGAVTTLKGGGIDTAGDYLRGFHWVGTWSLYIPRDVINKLCYYEKI
jgi:glycosyltransferase involved in cell wall biosynthesis